MLLHLIADLLFAAEGRGTETWPNPNQLLQSELETWNIEAVYYTKEFSSGFSLVLMFLKADKYWWFLVFCAYLYLKCPVVSETATYRNCYGNDLNMMLSLLSVRYIPSLSLLRVFMLQYAFPLSRPFFHHNNFSLPLVFTCSPFSSTIPSNSHSVYSPLALSLSSHSRQADLLTSINLIASYSTNDQRSVM